MGASHEDSDQFLLISGRSFYPAGESPEIDTLLASATGVIGEKRARRVVLVSGLCGIGQSSG